MPVMWLAAVLRRSWMRNSTPVVFLIRSRGFCSVAIGWAPRGLANTEGDPPDRRRISFTIRCAWALSQTRCARPFFALSAGIVHQPVAGCG